MKRAVQILLVAVTCVLVRAQPVNDTFTNRMILRGTEFTVEGTVNGATLEEGEPHEYSDERSVWFRWSPPSDGLVHLWGTGPCPGTLCPPIMGVYEGEALTNLTVVATNAIVPGRFEMEGTLRFEVKFGVQYLIRVARSGEGAFSLSLEFKNFWLEYPRYGADLDVAQEVVLKMSALPAWRAGEFSRVGFYSVNNTLLGVAEAPEYELRMRDMAPGRHYVWPQATNGVGEVVHFPGTSFTLSAKGAQGKLSVWQVSPLLVAISGPDGMHYTLETSQDMVSWKVHSTDWLSTSPTLVSGEEFLGGGGMYFPPVELPKKFYRLKIH